LNVDGQLDLSGLALQLDGNHQPQVGESFRIVNNVSVEPTSGTFAGLPEGSVITGFLGSNLAAVVTYSGGDGNDVVLTVLPSGDIYVDTFEDVIDPDDGLTSLREAIIQANGNSEHQTIVLPAGTYALSISGSGEDQALAGDLDILPGGGIALVGAGIGQTVIDASGLGDRVFHILAGAELNLQGLTVTGGQVSGMEAASSMPGNCNWRMSPSRIIPRRTEEASGTSDNSRSWTARFREYDFGNRRRDFQRRRGEVTIVRSTVSGNTARHGGGLWSNSTATVVDSTFASNQVSVDGGAIVQHRAGH
jgi:hypothetical protein